MNIMSLARGAEPDLLRTHPASWELFRLADIYRTDPARDALFAAAMRESTLWHAERVPAYRAICDKAGFDPAAAPDMLDRIPALSSQLFKDTDLAPPDRSALFAVHSSGTGGRKTTVYLDRETIVRMWAMGLSTFEAEGLVVPEPAAYVIFSAPPGAIAGHGNGLFFTTLTELAPPVSVTYALAVKPPEGSSAEPSLTLDLASIEATLRAAAAKGTAVRLIGLPALMLEVARKVKIELPPGSLVVTGGGWKGQGDLALPKPELRRIFGDAWGMPDDRIRDLFGMTEHAVHYLECREHHFHAPAFSRVRIVDPISLAPMPAGEEGLVHLLNPGLTTMPVQSLVTADAGRALSACSCGRKTPAFEITRRLLPSEVRGCAATTLDRVAP